MISPARFFVSLNVKIIAKHFIDNYEFKVVEKGLSTTFTYRVLEMPHPLLEILVRKREDTL